MARPVAGSTESSVAPSLAGRHCPLMSMRAGRARKARVAGRSSGIVIIVESELRLVEIGITAVVGRETGETDALPHARVAEVKRADIRADLAEEGG